MSTLKVIKVNALKQDEKCWGCGDTLTKGSHATLHVERAAGKEMVIEKSYWCDCCVAYSEKFGGAYIIHGMNEGDYKGSPLYDKFRTEFEKEKKSQE